MKNALPACQRSCIKYIVIAIKRLQIMGTVRCFKIAAKILLRIRSTVYILYCYHIASLQRKAQLHIGLLACGYPFAALTIINSIYTGRNFDLLRLVMIISNVHCLALMKPLVIEIPSILRTAIADDYCRILSCYGFSCVFRHPIRSQDNILGCKIPCHICRPFRLILAYPSTGDCII